MLRENNFSFRKPLYSEEHIIGRYDCGGVVCVRRFQVCIRKHSRKISIWSFLLAYLKREWLLYYVPTVTATDYELPSWLYIRFKLEFGFQIACILNQQTYQLSSDFTLFSDKVMQWLQVFTVFFLLRFCLRKSKVSHITSGGHARKGDRMVALRQSMLDATWRLV